MKKTLLKPTAKYIVVITSYQPTNQVLAQYIQNHKKHVLSSIAVQYSDELIVIACIVLLILCSVIGVFYRTPVYGGKPIPLLLKIPICVTGGLFAFLYCLHIDKALTLFTPFWVGGISFISPAIIHLTHAWLIKKIGMKFGVDETILSKNVSNKED
ncbi:TPA: hypothetical protein MW252_003815 [Acinetobacter nosocomialis]|nr:hypothetical protein [Acinetobacter nosocomialis]